MSRFGKLFYCGMYINFSRSKLSDNIILINIINNTKTLYMANYVNVELLNLMNNNNKIKCIIIDKGYNLYSPFLFGLSKYGFEKIIIKNCFKIVKHDYKELSLCKKLIYLDLHISLTAPIQMCFKSVRVFKIRCDDIIDMRFIKECHNLEYLIISNCVNLLSLDGLYSNCPNLKRIYIVGCKKLRENLLCLTGLCSNFPNLKRTRIVRRKKKVDVTVVMDGGSRIQIRINTSDMIMPQDMPTYKIYF